jgi:hypothetical protein
MTAEQHHDQHENRSTAGVASAASRPSPTPTTEPMARATEMRGTTRTAKASAGADHAAPLFSDSESQELCSRWGEIQASFVDQPRRAVEQADSRVAETIRHLAQMFARASDSSSSSSGTAATMSQPRICVSRCSAIGPSSLGCSRSHS